MEKSKRVAVYVRVSTDDQTNDNQLIDLRRYAAERQWQIFDEFPDKGISGSKESRPALDRLMSAVRKRQVDVVLVWRFDRFARSVKHLVLALEEMRRLNVAFVSYQENIDTGSPLGQAIFTIIAAMAELERNIIVERVKAGLRRATAKGKKLGRPVGSKMDVAAISKLRGEGYSIRQVAQRLNVSVGTAHRLIKAR